MSRHGPAGVGRPAPREGARSEGPEVAVPSSSWISRARPAGTRAAGRSGAEMGVRGIDSADLADAITPRPSPRVPSMFRPRPAQETRLLAIASAGGHWIQLLRLRPAFAGAKVTWATTRPDLAAPVDGPVRVIVDGSAWQPFRLLRALFQIVWLMVRLRPHVVVTTGAAPGALAIVLGRLLGARTVWIDSIANCEQISRSGRFVRRFAVVWLTQWEHLAAPGGPAYWGAIL